MEADVDYAIYDDGVSAVMLWPFSDDVAAYLEDASFAQHMTFEAPAGALLVNRDFARILLIQLMKQGFIGRDWDAAEAEQATRKAVSEYVLNFAEVFEASGLQGVARRLREKVAVADAVADLQTVVARTRVVAPDLYEHIMGTEEQDDRRRRRWWRLRDW